MSSCCPVLELRQYTLHPGTRETLVRLFDENFVEGQEEYGIRLVGQFRDLGDPDRFVWIRGFHDMEARTQAINSFYSGPVWKRHAEEANATMVDFSDVFLLKPAGAGTGFRFDPRSRPGLDDPDRPGGVIVATIHHFDGAVDSSFSSWFRAEVVPALARAGISVLAQLVTESAPNPIAPLPVREGENVFVWFSAHPDQQSRLASYRQLEQLPPWRDTVGPKLRALTKGGPDRLILAPTRRSWLRYRPDAAMYHRPW